MPNLEPAHAAALAQRIVEALHTTLPHLIQHSFVAPGESIQPAALHPAFHGSYDWHSSVHMHWSLVRLINLHPDLPDLLQTAPQVLDKNLTSANIVVETAYFDAPSRTSFERPYGWAWVLKLDLELFRCAHPRAPQWRAALAPLVEKIAGMLESHLQTLGHPIRHGVHSNTAFACVLGLQWARAMPRWPLVDVIEARATHWFGNDVAHGVFWEPSGTDFLSPTLTEALLMSQVLGGDAFRAWFDAFLPVALTETPLAHVITPTDRSDGQLVHGDGLNLSRAWCARGIINCLGLGSEASVFLRALSTESVTHSAPQVLAGEFVATHWLASFWLLAETEFEALV
jgi:Protein of unknown function (DUF2891)